LRERRSASRPAVSCGDYLIGDPTRLGLDFAFAGIFIALALPFWKRSGGLPEAIAGATAVLVGPRAPMAVVILVAMATVVAMRHILG